MRSHRRVTGWVAALMAGGCTANPAFDGPVGGGDEGGEGGAAVRVSDLRTAWTTPNQIRWSWAADGDGDTLLRYELVTGASEAEVRSGTAITVWNEARNPELGRFLLPHTGAGDPVVATTTDGHAPDTVVYAQLFAIDSAGHRSASNIAAARTTPAPLAEAVVFSEAELPGYSIPDTFQLAQTPGYDDGAFTYRYTSACTGASSECWENLRRYELGVDLSAISAGNFATTAYLELAVRVVDADVPWWSEVWLAFDPACSECVARYDGWTLRADDEWQLVQVPLRVLALDGRPLTHAELADGLFAFNVGASWTDGAVIDVDEIRIRW